MRSNLDRRLGALENTVIVEAERIAGQRLAIHDDPYFWFSMWFALEFTGAGMVQRACIQLNDDDLNQEIDAALAYWQEQVTEYAGPYILLLPEDIEDCLTWLRSSAAYIREPQGRTEWWWIGGDGGATHHRLSALNAAVRNWCIQTGEERPYTIDACTALLERWQAIYTTKEFTS